MAENTSDVLHRVQTIEERMDKIEDKIVLHGEANVSIQGDLRAMRNEFTDLKSDVLKTVKEQTDRTWMLIDRGGKVILILITIIVIFSGTKLGPEILKELLK